MWLGWGVPNIIKDLVRIVIRHVRSQVTLYMLHFERILFTYICCTRHGVRYPEAKGVKFQIPLLVGKDL